MSLGLISWSWRQLLVPEEESKPLIDEITFNFSRGGYKTGLFVSELPNLFSFVTANPSHEHDWTLRRSMAVLSNGVMVFMWSCMSNNDFFLISYEGRPALSPHPMFQSLSFVFLSIPCTIWQPSIYQCREKGWGYYCVFIVVCYVIPSRYRELLWSTWPERQMQLIVKLGNPPSYTLMSCCTELVLIAAAVLEQKVCVCVCVGAESCIAESEGWRSEGGGENWRCGVETNIKQQHTWRVDRCDHAIMCIRTRVVDFLLNYFI